MRPENYTLKKVVFGITTFLRPESLKRLIASIRKYYPEQDIIVVSQDKELPEIKDHNCLVIQNKFDCGLSSARNTLINFAKRNYKFLLLLEDDFVFTEKTDIDLLLKKMYNERNRNVGVVGGMVTEMGTEVHFEFDFIRDGNSLICVQPESDRCDVVLNFSLINLDVFKDICGWDENIKINGEHTDFFLRLKENSSWQVFYEPNCVIDTDKSLDRVNFREYKTFRKRDEFMIYLLKKHKVNKIVYPSGRTYELKNDVLLKYKSL